MITEMERAGQIDRSLEALPTDEDLAARVIAGRGLTSPELAVLLAYTKIIAEREITDSCLPDDPWTNEVLAGYFPTPVRERFGDRMHAHPLRREIVSTTLVNEAVNRGGISFLYRGTEETGASSADLVRGYVVMRDVYDLPALWRDIEQLDNQVPSAAQTALQSESRRLIDRAVRWLVANRRSPIDVTGEINRLRPGVQALLPRLDSLFRGRELRSVRQHAAALAEQGIPVELAQRATRVTYSFGLLDVVEVAHAAGRDLDEVASVYYALSDRFLVDNLLSQISALPREDRWQTLARMALRYDLYAALAALTGEVLSASTPSASAEDKVLQWEDSNAASIARARVAMAEFDDTRADLASLSVLLRQIRTLVRASAS